MNTSKVMKVEMKIDEGMDCMDKWINGLKNMEHMPKTSTNVKFIVERFHTFRHTFFNGFEMMLVPHAEIQEF